MSGKKTWLLFISLLIYANSLPIMGQQSYWTHFRGSNLNGISNEILEPLRWNDSLNIQWKVPVEGMGWSSPVVYGDQVWLTTASGDGKTMKGICLSLLTGAPLYKIDLFSPDTVFSKHTINSYATPTPCIEKGFVYLHFGTYGTSCISTETGKEVWTRKDLNCNHVQGPGSSPIIYKDLLILHLEGIDKQKIYALNKRTGETIWQTERPIELYEPLAPIGKKAYITPIIVNVKGRDLLISNGSAVCIAYNAETGKEVWRVIKGEDSTISMPVTENGIVYFYTGYFTNSDGEKNAELLAVDPDGEGDISETNILWSMKSPILQLLTPIIKDGLIYTIDTQNVLSCIDAKSGAIAFSSKLKSKFNSSPVFANGYIYFTSVKGETLILKHGRELNIIRENKLPGEVYATPAIVDKSILIRTDKFLYRIGEKVSSEN